MKNIRDFNLTGKKVIIRVDFNVPIQDGQITDDNRIRQSIKTIQYAVENGAKVILLSHLGRIENEQDKMKNNLQIVVEPLSQLLQTSVLFCEETRGSLLEEMVDTLEDGQVLLVQNTRYEDLNGKLESKNDHELGKYWASLGDIFINDAFATSHRSHASNVGIASFLPSGIGFLIEEELSHFKKVLEEPSHPFTIILGGSKVKDKIGLLENLIEKADYILIGGAMAYTFIKASGLPIGKSLLDEKQLDFCKNLLDRYPDKIVLPIDGIYAENEESIGTQKFISDCKENEMGFDIGHNTLKVFRQYLEESKTIVWNGPVGMFEKEEFEHGTKGICEILNNIEAFKIVGGGDTASALSKFDYIGAVDFVSTGGGASLELLEGHMLHALAVIEDQNEK